MDNTIVWPGWETVREIGRGSFGTVYEIRRTLFGEVEKAALKVISIPQSTGDVEELRSSGYDDESITNTFREHLKNIVREYSLMRKMNGHTNIVNCDDVRIVQHNDGIGWDIYIKMELLTPLTKALPEIVSEETVIKIALDMCSALELCGNFDIIHRDIKPQNIFVSENQEYKLGDFGVAKIVEKTTGGTKVGTYKYMAPEVYNNQPYGSAADIYSLGLVLYWLLNRRRMPFLPLPPAKLSVGMEENARNRRLSGEPIPAPQGGSPGLKRIVLKACAYNVSDRYTDLQQMKEELLRLSGIGEEPEHEEAAPGRFSREVPVNTPPVRAPKVEDDLPRETEPWEHGRAPARRKWLLPVIAASCLLIGLVVTGSVLLFSRDSEKPKAAALPTLEASTEAESEPLAEVVTEPVTEAVTEPVTEAVTEPVTEAVTEPVTEAVTEPVTEAITEPVTEAVTEITVEVTTEDETARLDEAYAAAEQLLQLGQYDQAIAAFENLYGYRDSSQRIAEARQMQGYAYAQELQKCGRIPEAAMTYNALGERQQSFDLWSLVAPRETIGVGLLSTVALRTDGTVAAVGSNEYGQCNVADWNNITAISVGDYFTVGLRSDGTVLAVGDNSFGQCDVSGWTDIVAISAGDFHTAGLKSDGTVVATGYDAIGQCNVGDWQYMTAVSVGGSHTVGLKCDGTVVAVGDNQYGQCDGSGWWSIVAVDAGRDHTVGLRSDGTVAAVGNNEYGQCNVGDWTDIVAVAANDYNTLGLKADGTVVATGSFLPDTGSWWDMVALSGGDIHTVGLKSDGTMVAVGFNENGQCDVDGWYGIKLPLISEAHRTKLEAARQAQEAARQAEEAARQAEEASQTEPVVNQGSTTQPGCISFIDGDWESVTMNNGGSQLNIHAWAFAQELRRCKELTVEMEVSMNAGTHCTDWQVWGRVNGSFEKIGKIYLPGGDGYVCQTIKFNTPITFDAVAITPTIPGGYSWSMGFILKDVWTD